MGWVGEGDGGGGWGNVSLLGWGNKLVRREKVPIAVKHRDCRSSDLSQGPSSLTRHILLRPTNESLLPVCGQEAVTSAPMGVFLVSFFLKLVLDRTNKM